MKEQKLFSPRILVVDDEDCILDDFHKRLCHRINLRGESRLDTLGAKLFGGSSTSTTSLLPTSVNVVLCGQDGESVEKVEVGMPTTFDIVLCHQGEEAVEEVRTAIEENKPFAVAFLDVRMPPGQDGVTTAERIRELDQLIQIVIVTAYSDVDPLEISRRVPPTDKLLYIQKPVHPQEIRQLALALGAKWFAERQLLRVLKLASSNEGLRREIAHRKKAETALESLNKELEATVGKLTAANRRLGDFAHIAAHDLKAPLRAIGTLAMVISTDYSDKLDEEGRKQLDLLVKRASRMAGLIDGISRYSEVGRGVGAKEKVELNKVVEEVIDEIAVGENVQITIEKVLPTVACEKTHAWQVFQNLLDNAVKYMDKPQGQVRIGCEEEGDFWRFSVADNGPGIEEKYFERIFEIFQTLSPRDEVESTGIGLSLVRKIVEIYGGKVWVESQVGEGSTFFFTMPKEKVEAEDTVQQGR